MKRRRVVAVVTVLILAGFSALGCCKKQEDRILELNKDLSTQRNRQKDLQGQLARAATQEAELKAQLQQKTTELAEANQQIVELNAKVVEAGKKAGDDTSEAAKPAYKVTVGSDILFSAGRAKLTSAGAAALGRIAGEIRGKYAGLPIRVYGYTDNDRIRKTRRLWQDNLDLSANRAMEVTRYLVSKGIDKESIETIAMGATHFMTSNTTRAGKAKNRRVEIVVMKQ